MKSVTEERFNDKEVVRNCKSQKNVQTEKWPKEKGQKVVDKTLHEKPKTEQHVNPTNSVGELRWSGKVSSSCYTSGTCRITVK